MWTPLRLVLIAVMAWGAIAQNFYDSSPHILELSPSNFDQVVHQTNYTTLVEFYAPWCGYCQQLKGTMQKAARSLDGLVQVASVNCDVAKNKPLCARHRVEGFPTLVVFRPPKIDLSVPFADRMRITNHASEVYRGERKLRPLVDFAASRIKNYVRRFTKPMSAVAALETSESRYVMFLFSKSDRVSPLYKSLALDWLGTVRFALVPNGKLASASQVTSSQLPRIAGFFQDLSSSDQHTSESSKLVLFDTQDDEFHVYGGAIDKLALAQFLSKFAAPNEGPLTQRQAFVDAVKAGKKFKKSKQNQKHHHHDEL
ncbi:LAMI_0A03818g1_1 [Lachancea mirantina]|uniref:LAMI_0A03818g1_1 n=1 Tax=Lachancea mirantina TaxID=1230905 RepID=A0A1G4IP27_9SACH|nr:LAMI_0A03818g1_1 [Lachancea mirantina]